MSSATRTNRQKSASNRPPGKKEAVLETGKGRRKTVRWVIVSGLILLMAASSAYLVNRAGHAPQPSAVAKEVRHPVALFEDGKARHFQLETAEGITVRYFVLKSSDGVIRAAFDACDVCWRSGRGYVQEGDLMVCVNCGRRFASIHINEVKGGCNPAPLKRAVVGNELVIQVEDLRSGGRYFDFRGRGAS
jgi:uncharacterized membrane protein